MDSVATRVCFSYRNVVQFHLHRLAQTERPSMTGAPVAQLKLKRLGSRTREALVVGGGRGGGQR